MIKRWDDGRIKFSQNDKSPEEWYKLIWHKGSPVYRRDKENILIQVGSMGVYFNGKWVSIGYNDLDRHVFKKILPILKRKWQSEYEYLKEKTNYMYYVENNIDYTFERFCHFDIYKPVNFKSVYEVLEEDRNGN
jgi:hypothetical protein